MVEVNGSVNMEGVQSDATTDISYDAKCALAIPIARPLATRKFSKKLYKCSKAAIKVRYLIKSMLELFYLLDKRVDHS